MSSEAFVNFVYKRGSAIPLGTKSLSLAPAPRPRDHTSSQNQKPWEQADVYWWPPKQVLRILLECILVNDCYSFREIC